MSLFIVISIHGTSFPIKSQLKKNHLIRCKLVKFEPKHLHRNQGPWNVKDMVKSSPGGKLGGIVVLF